MFIALIKLLALTKRKIMISVKSIFFLFHLVICFKKKKDDMITHIKVGPGPNKLQVPRMRPQANRVCMKLLDGLRGRSNMKVLYFPTWFVPFTQSVYKKRKLSTRPIEKGEESNKRAARQPDPCKKQGRKWQTGSKTTQPIEKRGGRKEGRNEL